jgi:hypothetical protein
MPDYMEVPEPILNSLYDEPSEYRNIEKTKSSFGSGKRVITVNKVDRWPQRSSGREELNQASVKSRTSRQ